MSVFAKEKDDAPEVTAPTGPAGRTVPVGCRSKRSLHKAHAKRDRTWRWAELARLVPGSTKRYP